MVNSAWVPGRAFGSVNTGNNNLSDLNPDLSPAPREKAGSDPQKLSGSRSNPQKYSPQLLYDYYDI